MTANECFSKLSISDVAFTPFGRDRTWKEDIFRTEMIELTRYHQRHCGYYHNILAAGERNIQDESTLSDLPFIPVRLFKNRILTSIPPERIQHILTSSGTTGNNLSRIFLDRETSLRQMQALTSIVGSVLGKKNVPMLIIDCPSAMQTTNGYSARATGIQGFSLFGKNRTFALDDNMMPDICTINNFLQTVNGAPFFIFGFTYIIWRHFIQQLAQQNITLDFANALMIHGGGRKNLIDNFITAEQFRTTLQQYTGLYKIHNYYGMVEQTGSIFLECEHQHLHCSAFSDVFIRRSTDFSRCDYGERGIIQTLSILPRSYPGHNLLTEDEGVLLGEDDCPCGRSGKYFKVIKRLVNAELKGCGDDNSIYK
jgi:phenylacetate-coenzyme A ligase PaaK-like adenylate-forming protein